MPHHVIDLEYVRIIAKVADDEIPGAVTIASQPMRMQRIVPRADNHQMLFCHVASSDCRYNPLADTRRSTQSYLLSATLESAITRSAGIADPDGGDGSCGAEARLVIKPNVAPIPTPISGVVPANAAITNPGSKLNLSPATNSAAPGSRGPRRRKSRTINKASSVPPMMPVLLRMATYQFEVRAEPKPTPRPFV